MGINVVVAAEESETAMHQPKQKKVTYTNASLPFPRDGHADQYLAWWKEQVVPTVIDWAGALHGNSNSWGTNSHPEFVRVVGDEWVRVFPRLADVKDHPAIYAVVSPALPGSTGILLWLLIRSPYTNILLALHICTRHKLVYGIGAARLVKLQGSVQLTMRMCLLSAASEIR